MSRVTVPGPETPGASPFSIDIPDGWSPVIVDGTALTVMRNEDRDGFTPNLIVHVDQIPADSTLTEVLAATLDDGDKVAGVDLAGVPGAESVGTINGRPALFRLVHLTTRVPEHTVELDQTQVYTMLPSRYSGLADLLQIFGTSTTDGIGQDAEVFTTMVRSIRPET